MRHWNSVLCLYQAKKEGQPLYKLARQGIEIERKARLVTIHQLDFLDYENGIISLEVSFVAVISPSQSKVSVICPNCPRTK
jgi:tRNA U55 pseudouridine synthase TruB